MWALNKTIWDWFSKLWRSLSIIKGIIWVNSPLCLMFCAKLINICNSLFELLPSCLECAENIINQLNWKYKFKNHSFCCSIELNCISIEMITKDRLISRFAFLHLKSLNFFRFHVFYGCWPYFDQRWLFTPPCFSFSFPKQAEWRHALWQKEGEEGDEDKIEAACYS